MPYNLKMISFCFVLLSTFSAKAEDGVGQSYLLTYPSTFENYDEIVLDIAYEGIFMATCEMNEGCLLRHPYVRVQDNVERKKIMEEFFTTREGALNRLQDECVKSGCKVFRHGRMADIVDGAKDWGAVRSEKCLQIYLHIADDKQEMDLLRREVMAKINTYGVDVFNLPSKRLCNDLGFLAVYRGQTNQINFSERALQ